MENQQTATTENLDCIEVNEDIENTMSRKIRVFSSLFRMGGEFSPPIGGGHMGGDNSQMGGESRVNFATFCKVQFFKI